MVFFSFGLPSRFAEWCDALILRLVEYQFGSVEAVALNSLEELAGAVIKGTAANLVACCRQPVVRLQAEVLAAGHPFLVALGDPRAALWNLVERSGFSVVDATRAVASSCATLLTITKVPQALVLTPDDGQNPRAAVAAIARHFAIPIEASALGALADQVAAAGLAPEDLDGSAWWNGLPERQQSIANGALQPYIRHLAGYDLARMVWEPELFYTGTEPPGPLLALTNGPIDITGRPRFLVYGPFINLPPGAWAVDVVLGFSAEAVGMSFIVEVFSGAQLANTRIEVTGEQVVEARLLVTIGNAADQSVQIRVYNERAAFDGRLALGFVAFTPQEAIPPEIRERVANVLRQ